MINCLYRYSTSCVAWPFNPTLWHDRWIPRCGVTVQFRCRQGERSGFYLVANKDSAWVIDQKCDSAANPKSDRESSGYARTKEQTNVDRCHLNFQYFKHEYLWIFRGTGTLLAIIISKMTMKYLAQSFQWDVIPDIDWPHSSADYSHFSEPMTVNLNFLGTLMRCQVQVATGVVLSTEWLSPLIRIGVMFPISKLFEVRDLFPQPRDFEIHDPDGHEQCLDWWLS
jgi:hypothetical protein